MPYQKTIIVGGTAYTDIDVLACASAYNQLLRLLNQDSDTLISSQWNQTITQTIRSWKTEVNFNSNFNFKECKFILVDFSDPNYMNSAIPIDNVIEVFDHHYGYEKFWKEKLPYTTYIDTIGACATLIWEKFKQYNLYHKISFINANLLYTAIFSNTLNFQSKITHSRDKQAFEELSSYTELLPDWQKTYYLEVNRSFQQNPFQKLSQDTKHIILPYKSFSFGQIELWNATGFLQEYSKGLIQGKHKIDAKNSEESWLINIISIEEGRSYFFTDCELIKNLLLEITDAIEINQCFLQSSNLWLRKEILKQLSLNAQKVLV